MKTTADLEREIIRLRTTITTLIIWIAQSANSPLSRYEVDRLLAELEKK